MAGELIAVTSAHLDEGRISYWRTGAVATGDTYIGALQRAGLVPVVIPVIGSPPPKELLAPFSGLVLVGGGDVESWRYREDTHPRAYGQSVERDEIEIGLLEVALQRNIPVLGICRGAQVMNVAFGGTLRQHIPDIDGILEHGVPYHTAPAHHSVGVLSTSRLGAAVGERLDRCTSLHHQAVGNIGEGLLPVAWSDDGVVEAVEALATDAWVVAVQWHPEATAAEDAQQQAIFDAWAAEVASVIARTD